jgi:hypothetical protein
VITEPVKTSALYTNKPQTGTSVDINGQLHYCSCPFFLSILRREKMKKLICLAALLGIVSFGANAETKKISSANDSFEKSKNNHPGMWHTNTWYKKQGNLGTITVKSEAAQNGQNYIEIVNDSKQVYHLYTAKQYKVKGGDTVRVSAFVKGKGSFRLLLYCYSPKGKWLTSATPKAVKVDSSEWTKKDFAITVPTKKIRNEVVGNVRVAIVVDADSKIQIDNFAGQIDSKVEEKK